MATVKAQGVNVHSVNTVPLDSPWKWLAAGWSDLLRAPHVSLSFGVLFTAISLMLFFGLYFAGALSLMLPLAGGFLLLGPMIAVGLYETSRRLEANESVTLADMIAFSVRSPGQLAFMGVFLLIIYFVWLELAFLQFMLFLGPQSLQLENLLPSLLFTPSGIGLLVIGSLTGAVLALLVFAVTAVSIPLLMRREIDVVTASLTSIQAVARNPVTMLLWAALIAALMVFAFATFFLGLVFVFPLIGHASWHAYKSLIGPAPGD